MTVQKIDIAPAGCSFSFNVYRTEPVPMDNLYSIVGKDELSADLERLKPGFFKIEKFTGMIMTSFAFPQKQEVEVLKKGMVAKLEIPVLETARLIFIPGYLLVSGKTSAGKMALQVLTPFLNISGTFVRLQQEKLYELTEQAVVVKSIQFANIPHSEIEKVTLSGELEDVFTMGNLPLREAEIASFLGVFNTPYGIRSLKFSRSGKLQIQKSKKSPVSLDLVSWAVDAMCG